MKTLTAVQTKNFNSTLTSLVVFFTNIYNKLLIIKRQKISFGTVFFLTRCGGDALFDVGGGGKAPALIFQFYGCTPNFS